MKLPSLSEVPGLLSVKKKQQKNKNRNLQQNFQSAEYSLLKLNVKHLRVKHQERD